MTSHDLTDQCRLHMAAPHIRAARARGTRGCPRLAAPRSTLTQGENLLTHLLTILLTYLLTYFPTYPHAGREPVHRPRRRLLRARLLRRARMGPHHGIRLRRLQKLQIALYERPRQGCRHRGRGASRGPPPGSDDHHPQGPAPQRTRRGCARRDSGPHARRYTGPHARQRNVVRRARRGGGSECGRDRGDLDASRGHSRRRWLCARGCRRPVRAQVYEACVRTQGGGCGRALHSVQCHRVAVRAAESAAGGAGASSSHDT
jgi:hypothetical protein